MAIDDINAQGGIKALGGAKLKLVVIDAGDNVEKAKNAAQRMVAQEADLVGGTGAWLSAPSRSRSPRSPSAPSCRVLTLSYSDQITARGFKYVFQTSPTGGAAGRRRAARDRRARRSRHGQRAEDRRHHHGQHGRVGELRQADARGRASTKLGLKLVVDETFTPPLADATSLVQKVRSARPDVLFLLPTSVPDDKLLLEKLNEFGLGEGRVAGGRPTARTSGAPEMLKLRAART